MIIAPSLLAADFGKLAEEAQRAEAAGADWLHLDVMDGHFVPNLTMGPDIVRAMKRACKLPLDVHLMIERPDRFADRFLDAGADRVSVHIEAPHDVSRTLHEIRARGAKCGLAINPPTSLDLALPFLDQIDLLLLMTVNPGFGGQAFITEILDKARAASFLKRERHLHFHIEADGGVAAENAAVCRDAGFDVLVAGTSLFKAPDMAAAVQELRTRAG